MCCIPTKPAPLPVCPPKWSWKKRNSQFFFQSHPLTSQAQWQETNRHVDLQPPTKLLEIFNVKVDGRLCSVTNEMFHFWALIGCVPWQKQMYFQNKIKHTVHLCKEGNKWNRTWILVNNSDVKKVIKALPWIMQLFHHFSLSHFLKSSLCRWPQSILTVNQPQIEILSCDSLAFI